jgi:RNA polymerase sigma-70 factor (ECF subfamily)
VVLSEVVASLDPDRREAFVLTQVLGLSYAETAEICGCEIGTVRSRVSRARSTMVGRLRVEDLMRAPRATELGGPGGRSIDG